MSQSFQTFLARAIPSAVGDLEAAIDRLPADKQAWKPMGDARTAMDQVAEVAILSGSMVDLIKTRSFPQDYDFSQFQAQKDALVAKGLDELKATLKENSSRAVAAILEVSDEDLGVEVQMPWGAMSLSQIISYPYWNTIYHEGQINYIASMIGCL
jgi:uncharacterized damage-inducible protein DinB